MEGGKGAEKREGLPDLNFFDHFRNLANKESLVGEAGKEEIRNADEGGENVFIGVLDNPIEMNELESAIKSLKHDKSAGEDLILNDFILNASLNVRFIILMIF